LELPNEIIIEQSKSKTILIIVGSLIFVLCSLWILTISFETENVFDKLNNVFVKVIAFIGVVFFGFCGIYGVVMLFDSKPGLILNSFGITDNSSAIAVGQIPWYEIRGFSEFEMSGQKMLIVLVREPDKYINRGNFIRQKWNKATFKMVGSPISISANTLKINYDKLIELCVGFHERDKKNA